MSAYDWAVVAAVCAVLVTAAVWWNRSPDSRGYRDAWQESAAAAAREPITPPADPAVVAEIELLYQMCPDVIRVIELPHQTRRTEDNQ